MAHFAAERFEPLGNQHDRTTFSCGVEPLDRYLRTQASQDSRRRFAYSFVLVTQNEDIGGYYTLSSTSILLAELPGTIAKKLPRYPIVPATLMGRLAVDQKYHGLGFGESLLFDAFSRALRSEIASFAFIVDAKDEKAESFYERYGFTLLPSAGRRMFKSMSEIAALFA